MGTIATDAERPVVRRVRVDDAIEVAELCVQLGYEASARQIEERIGRLLDSGEGRVALVACVGEGVAGWIEASVEHHLQSEPFALITGLVVRDSVRGLGVGKRLCEEIERWAKGQGLKTLRVTSRSTRERAHQFYLREGFVLVKNSAVFEKVLG